MVNLIIYYTKNMKKIAWLVVIVFVVYALVSMVGKSSPSATSGTIKIGFVAPLTGDAASIGQPVSKAVELAVKEANDAGGINGNKIELIEEDGACNTKKASDAGSKLISIDKVVGIIGGLCSGESSAFGPNAMQNKVVMISPASSAPALSKLGKYFFRVYPSDEFQGKFAAEYIFNTMKIKKVAVIYTNTDWGTGIRAVFVNRFKELGGSIVLDEGTAQESRDFRTTLAKLKTSGAELVYVPIFPEGTVALMKQLKEAAIKVKVFGADAWSDTKFKTDVDGSFEAQYVEVKTGSSEDFTSKFMKAYPDQKIGIGTAQGYDATRILLNAIKSVGTEDGDKLASTIRATKFDGISGHIEFDQNGDMTEANYVIKKLLGNGKVEEVQ